MSPPAHLLERLLGEIPDPPSVPVRAPVHGARAAAAEGAAANAGIESAGRDTPTMPIALSLLHLGAGTGLPTVY